MAEPVFVVPQGDQAEFYGLTPAGQSEVSAMLTTLKRVHEAPGRTRIHAMKAASGGRRGMNWRSIRRKYYDYIKDGDWRVLVDGTKTRKVKQLDPDFCDYVQGLADNHVRAFAGAVDELYAHWYAGVEIPGYGTWQEWWAKRPEYKHRPLPERCPHDLPPGWSRANLRKLAPHPTQTALTRRGIAAAIETIPTCISTRVGLRPFEFLVFDDAETDFLICHHESGQVCKLEGLFCKDVSTDVWLRFGLRPGIKRDDGTRESLKRQDMLELAVQILTTYGWPRDYQSTWIVERGTATISEDDAAAIYEATEGRVVVEPTGMISGKVLVEGYADKAVGNFRAKAWIESGFNLLWNKLDSVRGQKSPRYDTAHRELETRKAIGTELMQVGKLLPAEVMLAERLPFEDLRGGFLCVCEALKRINTRTEHACEGFERMVEWRFRDMGIQEWQPMSKLQELPAAVREHIEVRRRLESPMDRMLRLQEEHKVIMQTMHPAAVSRILRDYHRKVKVIDGEISVTIDGKLYRYFDVDSPLCGAEEAEYLAYLPKGDLDAIYLTDGQGRYLGTLPRRIASVYGDVDARNRQLGAKRKLLARHVRSIRKRHGADIERALLDTDNTLALMARLDGSLLEAGPQVGGGTGNSIMEISSQVAQRHQAGVDEGQRARRDEALASMAADALMANAK